MAGLQHWHDRRKHLAARASSCSGRGLPAVADLPTLLGSWAFCSSPPAAFLLGDNCDLLMTESTGMAVYHAYILASASGVLYTGVTNNLERRVSEHKQQLCSSFTKKYEVFRLVYSEPFGDAQNAINREKQIKRWRREKKLALIRGINPKFRDLTEDFPR